MTSSKDFMPEWSLNKPKKQNKQSMEEMKSILKKSIPNFLKQ